MGLRSLFETTLKAAVAVEDTHGRVYFRGTTLSMRRVAVLMVAVLLVGVVSFSFVVSLTPAQTAPVVQETTEPQPVETTVEPVPRTTVEPLETTVEPVPETTEGTGAYRTGEAVGEQLDRLWESTKELGRGLWDSLTE